MRPHGQPPYEVPKEGKLPVTKIDAAIRQLETAITLWFFDGDPVSTCTLAFAAYEIITSLNDGFKGTPTMLTGRGIKEEYKELIVSLFRAAPNFFKHAGKDPYETHFFADKGMVAVLADAVLTYNQWNVGKRPIFEVFLTWLWLSHPGFLLKKPTDAGMDGRMVEILVREGKQSFFNQALPLQTRKLAGAG